jgi:hypothetical protein
MSQILYHVGQRVRLVGAGWAVEVDGTPMQGDVVLIANVINNGDGSFFESTTGGSAWWVDGVAGSRWHGEPVPDDTPIDWPKSTPEPEPEREPDAEDREPVKLAEVAATLLFEIRNRQARTLGYADGLLDRSPVTATGADPAYDLGYQEGCTARADLNH